MNISLKKILKQQTILHLTEIDYSYTKIQNILKVFFNKIIHTNSYTQAIDIYNKIHPNIIIIDIEIENCSGLEFIKKIRKENKNIPIIIITANKDTNNLIEAIKLNLIDYILKPVDINKLIHALNQSAKVILNSGNIITNINSSTSYNYTNKTINSKNNKLKLTKNEARLLELLLSNKNKFVKNENIRKLIWTNKEVSDSAFKSLFSRLSNKIGKETITNNFGVGYGIIEN